MHRWFNTPHIQQFYSLRSWSEADISAKLSPYIRGEKPVFGYIVFLGDLPIGYMQYYWLVDFPWPEQNLSEDITKHTAGLDFFIGNPNCLGKGVGAKVLEKALKKIIWPKFDYCIMDPNIKNLAMVRCGEKVGFKAHKIIHSKDALKRPIVLKLMIMKR